MSKLNSLSNNNLESGFNDFDDCAIYKINTKQSIIQTLDFFTPIVDDPYTFGLIAAANSLSDIYAMGGEPLFALNIVAFPTEELDLEILTSILKGGKDKCKEAGINILGGHSIKDDIPKYGLAVTGIIDNKNIKRNSTCKENDLIILTKPIGTGIITTAIKKGVATDIIIKNVQDLMATLNNNTAIKQNSNYINACTDVTGYGLLGHLTEMADSSGLTAEIDFHNIPAIKEATSFIKNDIVPGGTKNNLNFYKQKILFSKEINEYQKLILADAQTSGGLLLSVPEKYATKLVDEINNTSNYKSSIIGQFINKKENSIIVNE